MKTEKKLKLMICVTTGVTVLAVALASAAILLEFESDIGYYAQSAPIHTVTQVLMALLLAFVAVLTLTFKKHELCPILNYNSAAFRFFASMTACLSLLNAYVEFTTLRSNLASSDTAASNANAVTAIALLFSVASFFVYFNYCFGKNEKKSDGRGLCGMIVVGYLILHLMETHLVWSAQMNNPIKTALQLALIAVIFALTYTFKCEFPINKASGRLRIFFLLVCPIIALTFSIPTIIAYYARIYTSFNALVDAIYITCTCGFVVASYLPTKHAYPIAAAEWAEINAAAEAAEAAETAETTETAEATEATDTTDTTETTETTETEG